MIKVMFFAQLRDQLETSELQLPCFENRTVETLLNTLKARGENWQRVLSSNTLLVAVNQTMCNDNSALQSGDEVAFFPPVTGG